MPDKLPPVVPVIFYQGLMQWGYTTELRDLIDLEEAASLEDVSWVPSFSHFLIDQSRSKLEDFKGELKGRITQLLTRRPLTSLTPELSSLSFFLIKCNLEVRDHTSKINSNLKRTYDQANQMQFFTAASQWKQQRQSWIYWSNFSMR